jgi:hypothetical protein
MIYYTKTRFYNKQGQFDYEYNIEKAHSKITKLIPNCNHICRFGVLGLHLERRGIF